MADKNQELTPEQIAAMQAELEELKKDKERLAALEEENTILREKKAGKNDHTGKIVEGVFAAKLETPDGKKSTKKVQFIPGYVHCRLQSGEKVWSADLMKLANGKELSKEELKRSPDLATVSSTAAADWLTSLVRKGVNFLRIVPVILLLFGFTFSMDAQNFRSGHVEYFDVDTITNTGSVIFLPSKSAVGSNDQYAYLWQITTAEISDTTAAQVYVEESLFPSGDYWAPVDTITISSAGSLLISGNLKGFRQRLRVVGTETQSMQLRVGTMYRRL